MHPVVAATPCKHCGHAAWAFLKGREVTVGGYTTVIEEYECANPQCPGVKVENGREKGWPLSWAFVKA